MCGQWDRLPTALERLKSVPRSAGTGAFVLAGSLNYQPVVKVTPAGESRRRRVLCTAASRKNVCSAITQTTKNDGLRRQANGLLRIAASRKKGRLKAGRSHDWLPHEQAKGLLAQFFAAGEGSNL